MFRINRFTVPALVAAGCAAGSPSTPAPSPGGPAVPGDGRPVTPTEQAAVAMGMSIVASDEAGAPRLVRALVPRGATAGMTPEVAARDHVAALAPLWVQGARPVELANRGVQRLRNGASVVRLAQVVDGLPVSQGELRVLMHADGSLAAVSGTLLPSTVKPVFVSSPRDAVSRALDQLYGAARPQLAITEAGVDGAGWQLLDVAAAPQLRVTSARTRRELARVGDTLTAAWAVEVIGDAPPDPLRDLSIPGSAAYRYLITDAGGKVLRTTDLIK